ncbi:MAG: hypothetical protein ACKVQA_26155 [Burkholderiales bacterium]
MLHQKGVLKYPGSPASDDESISKRTPEPSAHDELSPADVRLLEVYLQRRDMSASLLTDLFPIFSMRTGPQFSSPNDFFGFIDKLPGPSFSSTTISLPCNPEPFHFAFRNILEMVRDLIAQHNGSFIDPFSRPPPGVVEGEFVHGSRFIELQSKLTAAAGPRAVLMPLILNSGAFGSLAGYCRSASRLSFLLLFLGYLQAVFSLQQYMRAIVLLSN